MPVPQPTAFDQRAAVEEVGRHGPSGRSARSTSETGDVTLQRRVDGGHQGRFVHLIGRLGVDQGQQIRERRPHLLQLGEDGQADLLSVKQARGSSGRNCPCS